MHKFYIFFFFQKMSGSIRFRERSGCRPCYNFHDSDDDDVKSTENYVSIDGNDGVSHFSFLC